MNQDSCSIRRPQCYQNLFTDQLKHLVAQFQNFWVVEKNPMVGLRQSEILQSRQCRVNYSDPTQSYQLIITDNQMKGLVEKLNNLQVIYDKDVKDLKSDLNQCKQPFMEVQSTIYSLALKLALSEQAESKKQLQQEIERLNSIIKQKDNDNEANTQNNLNNHNTRIEQKDEEIDRLKSQLSNALRDCDQLQQRLLEADFQSEAKFRDYEQKIAELQSENSQLSNDLDKMKSKHKESLGIQDSDIWCELDYHEVENQLSKTINSNDIQQLDNLNQQSESLMTMNCVRFIQHRCEVHGKPIEHLCINQICNHQSRSMCGRCVKRRAANIAHIDNILECLVRFKIKEKQMQNIKNAQLWQQFQNINYQIIEQLNQLCLNIDIMLHQVKRNQKVEYLINELTAKGNITQAQIEQLAIQIGTVITLDSEDECQINTNHNIEDESQYINIIELLSQHANILKQLQNVSFSVHAAEVIEVPNGIQKISDNR